MLNPDILIFVVFLAINLLVGLRCRGKKQTFKEYAIGNKNFSTATLTATIVATWASGSLFFNDLEQTYSNGLYLIIAVIIGGSLGLLITGYIIGPRMGSFLNHVSMADALSSIYGKSIQLITAISTVLMDIGYIAIQFKVISKVLAALFNYQGPWVTIIAATIIIIYSAFGGVKSVTFTDVIQFITFGTLLPVLALVIWHHIPDTSQVVHTLTTNPNFSFRHVISWSPQFMGTLAFMCYMMTPGLPPELFQRMAMARDIGQVKRSIAYAAGLLILMELFIIWIAILLLSDNPNLTTSQVVGYLIEKHTYTGLKGFLGVGLIALAMSSADSALNSCAVLVANDILPPLKITKHASVRVATLATFIIGFFAVLLTLSIQNILQILLLSANFSLPIITIPMLLTIFGFRTSKRVVFIGMGAGFTMTAVLLLYFKDINSFFPGMLANLVFLLGSHYLLKEKGGWIGIKAPSHLLPARQQRINAWKHYIHIIKPTNWYAYLQQNLPTQETTYPLIGIYIVVSTYFSFYFFKDHIITQYPRLQYIIFHSVLLIIFTLVTYPIWNEAFKKKKPLIIAAWYLSILYIFFFLGPLVTLISGLEREFLFLFIGNLIIASVILPFPLFLGMFIIALPLSWIAFQAITGINKLPTGFNFWQFKLIYFWTLVGSCLLVIFNIRNQHARVKTKLKQVYLEKLEAELTAKIFASLQDKGEEYETKIKVKSPAPLHRVEQVVTELKSSLEQVYIVELNTLPNEELAFERLANMMHELNHAFHEIRDRLSLSLSKISPAKLFDQVLWMYQAAIMDDNDYSEVVVKCFATFKKIECDIEKIKLLMSNTLQRAQMHNPTKKPLIMRIENTTIVYKIDDPSVKVMREDAIKITISTCKRQIQEQDFYIARPNKEVASTIRGAADPLLLQNLRILDSHYGYMGLELITPIDYQQFYVLPIQVTKLLRSKVLRNNWVSA